TVPVARHTEGPLVGGSLVEDVVALVAVVEAVERAFLVVRSGAVTALERARDRPPALERVRLAGLEAVEVPDAVEVRVGAEPRLVRAAADMRRTITTGRNAGNVGAIAVLGNPGRAGDVPDP